MRIKNRKRSNRLGIVRYTLVCMGFAVLLFQVMPVTTAFAGNSFERMLFSLRNPFVPVTLKHDVKQDANAGNIKKIEVVAPLKPFEQPKLEAERHPSRPKLPPMEVTGLVFKTVNPMAIINGQVVSTGDVVDGVMVKKIKEGGILFSYDSFIYFQEYHNK